MESNNNNVPFLMEGSHFFTTMATVKNYDTPELVVTFLSKLMKSQHDDPKVILKIYRALGNIVVLCSAQPTLLRLGPSCTQGRLDARGLSL